MKDGRFIFFWLPYPTKYSYNTFRTAYYLSLSRFPSDKAIHVGARQFLEEYVSDFDYNGMKSPSEGIFNGVEKHFIDSRIFNSLEHEKKTNHFTWAALMTGQVEELESHLRPLIEKLVAENNILGIVAWCNTPSLSVIAAEFGLKVIHNEMGPLRKPYYTHTAYLDFNGVNGNTECEARYEAFEVECAGKVPILSTKKILTLLSESDYRKEVTANIGPEVPFGIPLQVEDDSNILAYGNGFNNYELISWAKNTQKEYLVRKHPAGHVDYAEINDDSDTPIQFIKRCETILTVNSSVGLEARIYDRSVVYLGDSPFRLLSADFITGQQPSKLLEKLNFALFGYLIPFEYLYNYEYFKWRVSSPTEIEIYVQNLSFFLRKRGYLSSPYQTSPGPLGTGMAAGG